MGSKFDNWLASGDPGEGPEYDESRPYVAHIETYQPSGELSNIIQRPIEEFPQLLEQGLACITKKFEDGSEATISLGGGPWGDGRRDPVPTED